MQPVIFVVDDEPEIRKYVTTLLGVRDYRVIPLASAEELLDQRVPDGPGCLVLDVFLPGLSGLDAQNMIMAAFAHLPIVFISGQGSIPMSVQAMKAGAVNFLTKPFGKEELYPAVEQAVALSQALWAGLSEQRALEERLNRLTNRELDVLKLVAEGKLNKQIAVQLDIVEKTVKVHRGRAMQKLGVRSVAELVRFADRLELVSTHSD
jgi:FixJ family two-component response regulator